MKRNDIVILTGIFVLACEGAYIFDLLNTVPTPRIAPENDVRIALSTAPGSPYESVGKITYEFGTCTGSYKGNHVIISAAHCIEDMKKTSPGKSMAEFYLTYHLTDSGYRPTFKQKNEIIEIAAPANYPSEKSSTYHVLPGSAGYDIAFIKIQPTGENSFPLPKASFPLHSGAISPNVSQAGYNGDKPGLTGDPDCKILPQDQWESPYILSTDCAIVGGSSGGPLLDPDGRQIGVAESVTSDPKTGTVLKTNFTPITPGLKKAFEEFQNGTLKGKTEILPNGIKLIKFPYERVPVTMKTPVPVV